MMSGANVPELKGGWRNIVTKTSEGVFRGYLVGRIEAQAADGSWNNPQGFDPDRWNLVRDLMFDTVVEGAVLFVSDPRTRIDLETIAEGARLFQACFEAILDAEHVEHPRQIADQGLISHYNGSAWTTSCPPLPSGTV